MPKGLGRVRWPSLFHTCAPPPPYPRCSQQSKKHFAHQSHFFLFNPKKQIERITDLELEIEIPGWSENSGQLKEKMNEFLPTGRQTETSRCVLVSQGVNWSVNDHTQTHTHTHTHTDGCFFGAVTSRGKIERWMPLQPARVFRFEFFFRVGYSVNVTHTLTHTNTLISGIFRAFLVTTHQSVDDFFVFGSPKNIWKRRNDLNEKWFARLKSTRGRHQTGRE